MARQVVLHEASYHLYPDVFPKPDMQRRLRSALKLFGDTMLTWIWQPFHKLSLDQLYAAMMLRQRIFVIEQACLYLDADGVDPQCWHGLGYLPTGELAAYARIVPPASRYPEPSIGRVLIAPALRGSGTGYELMRQAIAETTRLYPGLPIRISAQAHLQGFYRRLGFEPVGQLYDDDGIPHVDMIASGQDDVRALAPHSRH